MALDEASGTKSAANKALAITITGVILKIPLVVLLITKSFFISFTKSYSGCKTGAPYLPPQNALVFLITPSIRKGTNKTIIKFKILIAIFTYPI